MFVMFSVFVLTIITVRIKEKNKLLNFNGTCSVSPGLINIFN